MLLIESEAEARLSSASREGLSGVILVATDFLCLPALLSKYSSYNCLLQVVAIHCIKRWQCTIMHF